MWSDLCQKSLDTKTAVFLLRHLISHEIFSFWFKWELKKASGILDWGEGPKEEHVCFAKSENWIADVFKTWYSRLSSQQFLMAYFGGGGVLLVKLICP